MREKLQEILDDEILLAINIATYSTCIFVAVMLYSK